MTVTAVLSLLRVADLSFSTTDPSLLQPALALAVAVWCVSLAAAARIWDDEDLDERAYPAAVAGTVVVGLGLIAVVLPGLYGTIVSQSLRAFGFGQSDTVLTIAEAQAAPGIAGGFDISTLNSFLFAQYGLAYVVALFGLVWMAFRTAYTEYRAEYVLLVVWSTFLWLMALTQTRFNYYLVLSVVVMTAWVFGHIVEAVNLDDVTGRIGDIEMYQVITVAAVFMLVFAPLLPPLAASSNAQAGGQPAFVVDAGSGFGPGAVTGWTGTGDWMSEHTPEVGDYGGADNAAEFPYYGTYPRTENYDYPDGAYGVLSWWDYGHWITVLAERPPHANPFQQNARSSSSFLQASSEERANAVLDAVSAVSGSGGQFDEMTTEELRALAANASGGGGEGVQYVVIDDQTAGEKFAAVTQWSVPPDNRQRLAAQNSEATGDNNQRLYFESRRYQLSRGNETLPVVSDRYRETMLARLYLDDTEGLENYRLVHESSQYSIVGGVVQPSGRIAPLRSTRIANGWDQDRANLSRRLDLARQQRAAIPTPQGGALYGASLEAAVKTFERVDGATITGQVAGSDENASVVAYVELETSTGRQFAYQQWVEPDEDGSFEVTVPYATDDTVGPDEGGTNTSVTAVTDYQIKVADSRIRGLIRTARIPNAAQTAVPETAVYGGETVSVGTISPPSPGDGNESDGDGQGDGAVTPAPAPAVSPGIASGADGGAPPSPVTATATAEPTG
jgi:dolichyl-diphosphooligosaccharide--protein glycosyltransferase